MLGGDREATGKKGGWGVENTWSSVFAYAALYF